MAVTYDKDLNYQALIDEAVAKGDYTSAARYEQQRNAKITDLNASGTNQWNAQQSTNYAQYLDSGYTPLGTHNDTGLTGEAANTVAQAKELYYKGKSLGDQSMMDFAHQMAEAARATAGYSGGADGSDYILLNNTPTPTGGQTMPTFSYDVAKPTYTSNYSARIDEMLNQILNREDFSYDVNNDQLYQQYATQYNREGNRSMNDTLAAAASQAGGMNSYAVTAAQQANNYYATQLNDKIPELYQLAYEMYLNDIDQQVRDLGLLQDMDDTQYGRYRDTMSDWYNDRDFAYGMYRDDMGDYKWQTEFDYNAGRAAIADQRWQTEWDYNVGRDQIADERYDQEWEYNVGRDQVADSRYESETAYNKAMDLLNAGSMPDDAMLQAAGMTKAQAEAILAYVKLGYDQALERGDYAPKVDTDSSGGGGGGGSSSGGTRNGSKAGDEPKEALLDEEPDPDPEPEEPTEVANNHGDSWVYVLGMGRLTWQELEMYVNNGKIKETISDGKLRYTLAK